MLFEVGRPVDEEQDRGMAAWGLLEPVSRSTRIDRELGLHRQCVRPHDSSNRLVGEICGSPVTPIAARNSAHTVREPDAGERGFSSFLFVASCLLNQFCSLQETLRRWLDLSAGGLRLIIGHYTSR